MLSQSLTFKNMAHFNIPKRLEISVICLQNFDVGLIINEISRFPQYGFIIFDLGSVEVSRVLSYVGLIVWGHIS